MGKFVIKTGKDGQYYFSLLAENSEIILTSEGYTTAASCNNGVESVKRNAPDSTSYVKKTSASGQPYFILKAANGEPIGRSEMYSSESARDEGIESVMRNAPGAITEV